MTQFVSDEFDLAHRMARIEHENDRLHERMGYWRERAGELEERLEQFMMAAPEGVLVNEAEKEVGRLQELHRKNVYDIRKFYADSTPLELTSVESWQKLADKIRNRSTAAFGGKE